MKPILTSKTILFNLFMLLAIVLTQPYPKLDPDVGEPRGLAHSAQAVEQAPLFGAAHSNFTLSGLQLDPLLLVVVVALGNVVLRFATKQPLLLPALPKFPLPALGLLAIAALLAMPDNSGLALATGLVVLPDSVRRYIKEILTYHPDAPSLYATLSGQVFLPDQRSQAEGYAATMREPLYELSRAEGLSFETEDTAPEDTAPEATPEELAAAAAKVAADVAAFNDGLAKVVAEAEKAFGEQLEEGTFLQPETSSAAPAPKNKAKA